jgi:hypothetical protein
MDLLHKRYASPFSFVDTLIENAGFYDFAQYLTNKVEEEKTETMEWDFFLHKVYGKSFADWKQEAQNQAAQSEVMTEAKKEEIVSRSNAILNGFNLPSQGGES